MRLPGGRATPQQWLVLDELSEEAFASPSLRLTTRQTFQFHGILKGNVKPLIQGMHEVLLDSIAACGDVNRNVMASPNPERNPILQRVYDDARAWSEYALPKTRAYHEIWLDEELVAGGEPESEPIYGPTYLPAQIQDGVRGASVERCGHLLAGSWFHRHRRERSAGRLQRHRGRRAWA